MKPEDLSIGDWVRYTRKRNHYHQVIENPKTTYIRIESIVEEGVNEEYRQGDFEWIEYDEISPIHLTKNILIANGFHFNEEFCEWWMDGCPFHIMLDCDFDGDCAWVLSEINPEIPLLLIKYVHTLQHALRLTVLSDLADNFKL